MFLFGYGLWNGYVWFVDLAEEIAVVVVSDLEGILSFLRLWCEFFGAKLCGICFVPAIAKVHRKCKKKKMGGAWQAPGTGLWPSGCLISVLAAYLRIALCGKAFSVAFIDKKLFTVLYIFCFVADEMSRYVAKLMNLSSALRDVLVHISSRISTTGLLLILSHVYRRDYKLVLLLLELDIASHWLRVYCEIMTRKSECPHLEKYQNFLYNHPVFRVFCSLSQEIMYITLYLVAFDWMEQGQPVKFDMRRLSHSKYFKSLAIAAPGYFIRQLALLDEIRLATALCLHFDAVPDCHNKVSFPVVVPDPEPVHVHVPVPTPPLGRRRRRSGSRARNRHVPLPTPPPRRRRQRSASRGRNRSRSQF